MTRQSIAARKMRHRMSINNSWKINCDAAAEEEKEKNWSKKIVAEGHLKRNSVKRKGQAFKAGRDNGGGPDITVIELYALIHLGICTCVCVRVCAVRVEAICHFEWIELDCV